MPAANGNEFDFATAATVVLAIVAMSALILVIWARADARMGAAQMRRSRPREFLYGACPICPGCGYDLRQSPRRCPECGRDNAGVVFVPPAVLQARLVEGTRILTRRAAELRQARAEKPER